jgi:hypothetical protein
MNKNILQTVLLFSCILIPSFVLSAPTITRVSEQAAEGNEIIIQGSNFGIAGPTLLFYDNFESGAVGEVIRTGAGSATIGEWYALNTAPPIYSSDTAVSGTKSFKVTTVEGVEGKTNGFIVLPDVTEIFISWWCYVPVSSPWPGEGESNGINWKIMWVYQTGTGDNDTYFVQLLKPSQWVMAGNDSPLRYPNTEPFNSGITKGSWHRYCWWIKDGYSNDGSSTISELTPSGDATIKNLSGVTTAISPDVRKILSVNGYTRQMTTTQAVQMFDDIYVAVGPNSRARVEIGNQPIYKDSTKLSICTPIKWAENEISVTFRKGSFDVDEARYLFVIDANGVASQGHLIPAPPDITLGN